MLKLATTREARLRRCAWIGWGLILVIAGFVYAARAAEEHSAFIRWRHQVHELWEGKNIWDAYVFPNPPIMPLALSPLMALPPTTGALAWYAIKCALAAGSIVAVLRMARGSVERAIPAWGELAVLLLCLRPMLSDLQHGNINLLILALIVAALAAWQAGRDTAAGLILALAVSFKLTPALFLVYFAFKRSWRTLGAAGVGLALFLVIIPALFLGPEFNGRCLISWWHRFLSPYVVGDVLTDQEVNQSLIGVLTRMVTEPESGSGERLLDLNLVNWSTATAARLAKAASLIVVGLLLFLTRDRSAARRDPRLLGEFALVVLAMLMISERSWKHHFVTLLLPYTFLIARVARPDWSTRSRVGLALCTAASALLMASTSSEIGGLFAGGIGHKIALYYGMFFWAAVLLFAATAFALGTMRTQTIEPDAGLRDRSYLTPRLARANRQVRV